MVRIRQAWLVGMLALGLIAGCKKEAATSATGDKSAEAPGGAAAVDDLSLLPADSEIVLGINVAQIQQSQLWKQFVEPKLAASEPNRKLTEIKARCGWDPVTATTSVVIGVRGTASDKPQMVMVAHGLDKTKSLDCLDKNKDEFVKDGTQMTRDGDVVLFKNKNGDTAAITFINNSTGLVVAGDNATPAGVKAVAAGGSTLKTSAAFVDMYKKVKTGDSLWGLASGKVLEKAPIKATAAYGSFNVSDGLALDVRIRFEKPEDATQAASLASGQAKQAAQFVDKAEFTAEGNEVHGSVVMSNQKLQAVVQQFAPMINMMMGR
jgi:hypothetical protein